MSKERITVLSLFDGMSCGQIALNKMGISYEHYYASEIDKHAIKVTQHNYPNTIQLGSVTRVRASNLPKIDLLIGGSPCQGFSYAGKQLNFDDERSKLFFEYVRVLNELKQDNPNIIFLLENVKMKKEYQDIITQHLGVEPVLINSSLFSAQNRERLYWTNLDIKEIPLSCELSIKDIIEDKGYKKIKIKNPQSIKHGKNYAQYDQSGKNHGSQDQRYYYLKSKTGTLTKSTSSIPKFEGDNNSYCYQSDVTFCEKLQGVPVGYTGIAKTNHAFEMLGNGWNVDTIAHIFQSL